MTLSEHYNELASIWRWAARYYAKRAAEESAITVRHEPEKVWSWNEAAVRASLRASHYARLSERSKP